MSSSAVMELETALQGMLALKPPGVSGSRIGAITALCVNNVQSESVLIQKIYTHFKKTPGSHKLGVLYVVDSVTRKWLEQAKQQGQVVNNTAPDGTYAAGVNRVTELMPVLMNDITSSAPADQKEKIKKLIDIWEKGQTFPAKMLESFKEKNNAPRPDASTTPPGSPPPNAFGITGQQDSKPAAPPAIPAGIMEALANIAKQSQQNQPTTALESKSHVAAPALSAPPPAPPLGLPFSLPPGMPGNIAMPPLLMNPPQSAPPPFLGAPQQPSLPVNAPQLPFPMPPLPLPGTQVPPFGVPASSSNAAGGFPGGVPPPPPPTAPAGGGVNNSMIQLIQTLANSGLTVEQISAVVAQMTANNTATPAPAVSAPAGAPQYAPPGQNGHGYSAPPPAPAGGWTASRPDESRDNSTYPDLRSPTRGRGRSRSRSPARHWDQRGSPRGRDGGSYGEYGQRPSPPGRGRGDDDRSRGGRGGAADYRQRSPAGRRNSSPQAAQRWVEHDPSLPNGHIRVLSRTLFVGGVTGSEAELRAIFSRFGEVQTCIVNKDKRHAFVKMYTRKDAVAAKEGMEKARAVDNNSLRTRWGVGFGPRDCSDYQTGISVIPIGRLTDADRKWMVTAPYGGTGGKPITTGLVVEEPDIEIGAGVSSKAISRRMQTDRGGANGPRSTRRPDDDHGNGDGGGGGGGGRAGGRNRGRGGGGGHNRRDSGRDSDNPNNIPVQSDFGFGLAVGANGMPVFPPGFVFPPPPGQNGS